jgi:3'(2'), 5'-bisphosphate nucleotidase
MTSSYPVAALAPAWARELEIAGRLAKEAGALAMRYRDGDLKVVEKAGGDGPVTIADRAASDLVVAGLRAAFPDDIVISEENADDLRRRSAPRVWFIDPIDGTKDYIRGEDGFCVMIGLAVDHRPAVGAVFQPISRRLFVAAPGAGAHVFAPGEPPRRLAVSAVSELSAVRMVASKSHRSAAVDQVKSALGIADELNIGSIGLKLALIAAGERDLYVNPSTRTSSWDTCAPEALLHEAGGLVTDLDGAPLRYDGETTHNCRGLLATNRRLHDAAQARLGPLFAGSLP